MALLTRDVAVLEEVSFGKPDKILPHGVLVACKQVQLIEYILPGVWLSYGKWKDRDKNVWIFLTISL